MFLSAPFDFTVENLSDFLQKRLSCTIEEQHLLQHHYCDTFDGILLQSGRALRIETQPAYHVAHLERRTPNKKHWECRIERLPRFAQDLPPSTLRDKVLERTGVRALLPVVTLEIKRTTLSILNAERKTVARVQHLASHAVQPNKLNSESSNPEPRNEIAPLARIRIESLRGYDKWYERVVRHLQSHPHIRNTHQDLYWETLEQSGIDPSDNSSRLRIALTPEMRTDEALRCVFSELYATMKRNEPGVREAIDSEFLHDFRVSVRRTRSAIGQMKKALPQPVHQRFAKEFKWLGTATTPLRDLDVYLLHFPEYEAELPPELRKDLSPLKSFLLSRQTAEHGRLVRRLNSKRYARLCADWERFLETPRPRRTRIVAAVRPIGEVASERIWRTYRQVWKKGRSIDDDSPADALHDLRKACKKLRYLMEFFRLLYEPASIGQAIKQLKELQDVLGSFQDQEVQQDTLRRFAEEMAADGTAPPATLIAMGMLVERLREHQEVSRNRFAARFERFANPDNSRLFKELFHSGNSTTASGKQ